MRKLKRVSESVNGYEILKYDLEKNAKNLSVLSKLLQASIGSAIENCSADSTSKFDKYVESFESYKNSMYDLLDELGDDMRTLKSIQPKNYLV